MTFCSSARVVLVLIFAAVNGLFFSASPLLAKQFSADVLDRPGIAGQQLDQPQECADKRVYRRSARTEEMLSQIRQSVRARNMLSPQTIPTSSISSHSATTATSLPVRLQLASKTVVVDAGHGGHDSGASAGRVQEKDINLAVARKVRDELVLRGAKVVMTRDSDHFVSLDGRVAIANQIRPDIFVSTHSNWSNSSAAYGVEAYYYDVDSASLARHLYCALVTKHGARGRWVAQRGFRVVKNTRMPACLVEVGYLSNAHERSQLADLTYQKRLAVAVAEGVVAFFSGNQPVCYVAGGSSSGKPNKKRIKRRAKPRGKRC